MKNSIKAFIILIIFYFLGMVVVFTIPNHFFTNNINSSILSINHEGNYPSLNSTDGIATRLDNFTDKVMINKSSSSDDNTFIAAMSVNNYARYWHGYLIFLRPLLVLVNYSVIRQLYGFLLVLLLAINFYLLIKKLDFFIACSLFLSFYFARFYTFFLSMQFSNVFILMLLFNIFLLTRKKININSSSVGSYFFIIGSLTNFFDLLTVPLITLGIPLIICLYATISQNNLDKTLSFKYIVKIIYISISWGIGYGMTWFSKWFFATITLQKNIFKDAFNTIIFRTEGNKQYPLDRVNMLKLNISTMFNKFNLLLLIILILVIIFVIIKRKENFKRSFNFNSLLLMAIGILPYIWYLVLANHSQIHYWFTYRLQIIAVFGLLSFLSFILSALFLPVEEAENNEKFL